MTEGNTGFGKAFATMNNDRVLNLRFPLHISRVKNEYSNAAKEKALKISNSAKETEQKAEHAAEEKSLEIKNAVKEATDK